MEKVRQHRGWRHSSMHLTRQILLFNSWSVLTEEASAPWHRGGHPFAQGSPQAGCSGLVRQAGATLLPCSIFTAWVLSSSVRSPASILWFSGGDPTLQSPCYNQVKGKHSFSVGVVWTLLKQPQAQSKSNSKRRVTCYSVSGAAALVGCGWW